MQGMSYTSADFRGACTPVQGSDWFQTETARLERLLGSGSVGSSKATEISKKLSVLTAFMPGTDSDEDEELTKAEE